MQDRLAGWLMVRKWLADGSQAEWSIPTLAEAPL